MQPKLGAVVARLQVADLHDGHRHLIETMLRENDAGLILIGDRDKIVGARNPLPYSVRRQMVIETFGDQVAVERLPDHPNDVRWSENLDATIDRLYPGYAVTLYCSRDGFADYYSGRFAVKEIAEYPAPSGTEQRTAILDELRAGGGTGNDYRRGFIAAATSRYPIVFSTVDVAVMNTSRTHLWLGQKVMDEGKWRFVGGFVDPTDATRQAAAVREAGEELGNIKLDNLVHLGSHRVNDFRYRDEPDGVMTDLFLATHVWGQAVASDDLDAIQWFPIDDLKELLIEAHQPLADLLIEYLERKGN